MVLSAMEQQLFRMEFRPITQLLAVVVAMVMMAMVRIVAVLQVALVRAGFVELGVMEIVVAFGADAQPDRWR